MERLGDDYVPPFLRNPQPKRKNEAVPKYTLILHGERASLKLSLAAYCVIDVIDRLSNRLEHPYCTTSKDRLAEWLGIDRATVFRAIKQGLDRRLLEKNERGDLRTTDLWYRTVVVSRNRAIQRR